MMNNAIKEAVKTLAIVVTIIVCTIAIIFNMPKQAVEYRVSYAECPAIECAICGGNVHDYWSIWNMDRTEMIDICEVCYLAECDFIEVIE